LRRRIIRRIAIRLAGLRKETVASGSLDKLLGMMGLFYEVLRAEQAELRQKEISIRIGIAVSSIWVNITTCRRRFTGVWRRQDLSV